MSHNDRRLNNHGVAMIPNCGKFQGEMFENVNFCGLINRKVERNVCVYCSKNTVLLTPITVNQMDQAAAALLKKQIGGCAGCPSNTHSRIVPKIWPQWAESLNAVKITSDVGVGDTAAREIERLGLEEFQRVYGITFGPECACQAKEWGPEARVGWNARYAYAP